MRLALETGRVQKNTVLGAGWRDLRRYFLLLYISVLLEMFTIYMHHVFLKQYQSKTKQQYFRHHPIQRINPAIGGSSK